MHSRSITCWRRLLGSWSCWWVECWAELAHSWAWAELLDMSPGSFVGPNLVASIHSSVLSCPSLSKPQKQNILWKKIKILQFQSYIWKKIQNWTKSNKVKWVRFKRFYLTFYKKRKNKWRFQFKKMVGSNQ